MQAFALAGSIGSLGASGPLAARASPAIRCVSASGPAEAPRPKSSSRRLGRILAWGEGRSAWVASVDISELV